MVSFAARSLTPLRFRRSAVGRSGPRRRLTDRIGAFTRKWIPQWLRTIAATVVLLSMSIMWIGLVSSPVTLAQTVVVAVLLPVVTAASVHLWPTRTAPWRTVAWVWFLSAWMGATVYMVGGAGVGNLGLNAAVVTGTLVLLGRANENARRVFRAAGTLRQLR